MAVVQPSTGGQAPQIEDGLYTVVCEGVEERTVDNDQYGNSEKLVFHLRIEDVLDEEGEDIILDPRINKKWSEMATLYKYAQAFGLKADPSQPIDTELFVGKKARAMVETEAEGKWPRITRLTQIKAATKNGTTATDPVNIPLSEWWAVTRARKWSRDEVMKLSDEMYGKEPAEIEPEERVLLLGEITQK